jgi:hypothetical protein
MDASSKTWRNNHPGTGNGPAIARYFDYQQIARFHAELSFICQQRRSQLQILTAREINDQAAQILARAAQRAKTEASAGKGKPTKHW